MKIKFKTLTLKNFSSYGNTPAEIHLDQDSMTLLIGLSGSGKTTILNALSFVLFDKFQRDIKKAEIVNETNGKNCEVTLTFEMGGSQYKVIRGIKNPITFQLTKDGVDLPEQNRNQKFFEQDVLRMNFKTFSKMVSITSKKHVPFMDLEMAERRALVDDIFDLGVLSKMKLLQKNRLTSLQYTIEGLNSKIENEKRIIAKNNTTIESLKIAAERGSDELKAEVLKLDLAVELANEKIAAIVTEKSTLETDIKPLIEKIKEHNAGIAEIDTLGKQDIALAERKIRLLKDKENEIRTLLRDKEVKISLLQTKISSNTAKIDKIKANTVCMACNQAIAQELIESQVKELEIEIRSDGDKLADNKNEMATVTKNWHTLNVEQQEAATKLKDANANLTSKLMAHRDGGAELNNAYTEKKNAHNMCNERLRSLTMQVDEMTKSLQVRYLKLEKMADLSNDETISTLLRENDEAGISLASKQNDIDDINDQLLVVKEAGDALKDDGIKAYIVSEYLAFLNASIEKYLYAMDLQIKFRLNDDFSENIESVNHHNCSYGRFSDGEGQRIDTAILLALRELCGAISSVDTNLLICDEILDNHLNPEASANMFKALSNVGIDNIVVISHKDVGIIGNIFDQIYVMDNSSGFTEIHEYNGD